SPCSYPRPTRAREQGGELGGRHRVALGSFERIVRPCLLAPRAAGALRGEPRTTGGSYDVATILSSRRPPATKMSRRFPPDRTGRGRVRSLRHPSAMSPPTDVRTLATLLDISRTLAGSPDLRGALLRVLEILEERHGTVAGAVTLLDPESRDLRIEAATGITWRVRRRASYRVGEGVTGRVVESGRPVIVPRV